MGRRYLARVFGEGAAAGDAARALMRAVWPGVARLEESCFGSGGPRQPPLFVVGLPRAGTTLLLQSLCHCLDVSYIPELAKFAPFAPAFATWAARRAQPRYRSTFTSQYGTSPGLASPSEATTWNLWFEKDRFYEDPEELSAGARRAVTGMVGRVERIGGGPFVNKNLRNNHRIRLLARLFPDARFLIVVRDLTAVATSLLVGRRELAGGLSSWFSIKPRDYDAFRDAPPAIQVARQVAGLLRDLSKDIAVVGAHRFAVVAYEDFCRRPTSFMDDLLAYLGPARGSFRRVADPPLAHAVRESGSFPFDAGIAAELAGALQTFSPGNLTEALPATWLAR